VGIGADVEVAMAVIAGVDASFAHAASNTMPTSNNTAIVQFAILVIHIDPRQFLS
jgi:hypothetical protein